jgi:hypothetical protein
VAFKTAVYRKINSPRELAQNFLILLTNSIKTPDKAFDNVGEIGRNRSSKQSSNEEIDIMGRGRKSKTKKMTRRKGQAAKKRRIKARKSAAKKA